VKETIPSGWVKEMVNSQSNPNMLLYGQLILKIKIKIFGRQKSL